MEYSSESFKNNLKVESKGKKIKCEGVLILTLKSQVFKLKKGKGFYISNVIVSIKKNNKAYRPNAHLLDILMHYDINII